MEENKSVAEIIRITAKNQFEFLNTIANHIDSIEAENANLKFELKKWSTTLEQPNNDQ
jgi:hypothetical protein